MWAWSLPLMAFSSFVLVAMVIQKASKIGCLAHPKQRSMHSTLTPSSGGLGFVVAWGIVGSWHWLRDPEFYSVWPAFLPAYLVAVAGFIDDRRELSSSLRLAIQLGAALLSIVLMAQLFPFRLLGLPSILSYLLALLAILWSTNLFNFMDGIDGIAALEAICVLFGAAVLFSIVAGGPMVVLLSSLGAAIAGFLSWNWPPARVFMGDVGSGFLGFIIAVTAIIGELAFGLPCTLWLLLFAVFWFDATVTLLRRLWYGNPGTQAHRSHAYQRLLLAGVSIHGILAALIALNGLFFLLALWVLHDSSRFWPAFAMTLVILSVCYCSVERLSPMARKQ